jgi:hypothetical protein
MRACSDMESLEDEESIEERLYMNKINLILKV